jgi:hypothetical protein
MSLVLFYQPEPHKDLQPAEELVDEACPALYKKLNVKTFANGFWDAFALGKRAHHRLSQCQGREGGRCVNDTDVWLVVCMDPN